MCCNASHSMDIHVIITAFGKKPHWLNHEINHEVESCFI